MGVVSGGFFQALDLGGFLIPGRRTMHLLVLFQADICAFAHERGA